MATRGESIELHYLHNIKRLRITIFDNEGRVRSSEEFNVGDADGCRVEYETYPIARRTEQALTSPQWLSVVDLSRTGQELTSSAAGRSEHQPDPSNAHIGRSPAMTPSPPTTIPPPDPEFCRSFLEMMAAESEHQPDPSNVHSDQSHAMTPSLPTTISPPESDYCRLLDKVIRAARVATFPAKDAINPTDLRMALQNQSSPATYTPRSAFVGLDRNERFNKIGAAGELYVFELLSRYQPLTGWYIDSWQSNVGDYVRAHPNHANIQQQRGDEKSDFVFNDTRGELTALLIEQGYINRTQWQYERPQYLIEVKTTTGRLETPFYMSAGQYKKVYMILRVYEIEGAGIAMKVYLNPGQMRKDRTLLFTQFAKYTWSVVPG